MELKNKFKKIICVITAAVAMAAVLTACARPFADTGIVRKTTGSGAEIPQVQGFMGEEKINQKLSDIFTPYAELAYQAVSDSDGELQVIYDLEETDSGSPFKPAYTLSMSIADKENHSIDITEVTISGVSSVAYVSQSDISWLSSADVIMSSFDLRSMGIDIDLSELNGDADNQFAVDMLIKVYEAFAGKELDISDIAVGESRGESYQKALKLGLITEYAYADSYEMPQNVKWDDLQSMSKTLLECIERDVYGRQSEGVTGGEFVRMIEFFCDAYMVDSESGSGYSWQDMCNVDFAAVAEKAEKSDSVIMRRDAAELIWKVNNEAPGYKAKFNDKGLPQLEDSDSVWVRRVMKYSFMNYYGDSILFAPKQDMTVLDALKNACSYAEKKYLNWMFADDYAWNPLYSREDIVVLAGMIVDYFADRPEAERNAVESKTVINDRDYNWFYSQQNTGEYSYVNCMPSIATMAAHWFDEESSSTVQKMRATSDVTEGWTAFELRNGLDAYNVPYSVVDATLDNIISALDEGRIVLAQYSDRPYSQSGHCYVIYGYKKIGESITFVVNDSDSLSDRMLIFGHQKGNGDEIEAKFAMWSISRFVSDVTVVG